MNEVHLVLPSVVDDPAHPSGGNTYDRHLASGLASLGWEVHRHLVPGDALGREPRALQGLAAALAEVPEQQPVVVDGLLASVADDVVVPAAGRLRLVVLVHALVGSQRDGGDARERRVLEAAEAVLVTSRWAGDRVREVHGLDPRRVHVVPPGVEPAAPATGSAGGTTLLSVGALTPVKGHDILAEALGRLAHLSWRWRCVGALDLDPAQVGRVRDRLAAAGVDDRLELTGPLVGGELDRAYASCDLMVLPSRTETYGMVVTEALARGLPVVASDVGGVREALGEVGDRPAGTLVAREDPDALARVLGHWLTDDALRRRMACVASVRRGGLVGWGPTAAGVLAVLTREPRPGGVRPHERIH